MRSHTSSRGVKSLLFLALIPLLILAACGGPSGTTGNQGTPSATKVTLKLGSKKDPEARILSTLYDLLLTKAGFDVKPITPGQNAFVLNGIKNGDIDLYPEFTSTGLDALKMKPSNDPEKDYQTVKTEFEKQFQITWLDFSPKLNDTYAICTLKTRADELGVKTISDLAPKLKDLTMALQPDGLYVIDFLTPVYGIKQDSFKALQKVDYAIGFKSVENKQTDLTFCYSTDVTIAQQNFVVIDDDKHAFPPYNPAPIVRDSILKANPKIADALNPLASLLTNEVSLDLQKKAIDAQNSGMSPDQSYKKVCTDFLQSKGLL